MKKWWRRTLNLIVVLALMLPCFLGISVYANDDILSADERLLLVEVLRDIESQKERWGLVGVEFKDLCLGKPVQTYDYVENRLVPGRELLPITVNGELVLWATKYEGKFQLSSGLVNEINRASIKGAPFALLYDDSAVYAYTQGNIVLLKEFAYKMDSRSTLDLETDLSASRITTVSLEENTPINYTAYSRQASSNYYYCNVSYVAQGNYNICWAASFASIYNYLYDDNELDALQVAISYLGIERLDDGISFDRELAGVFFRYNVDYIGMGHGLTDPLHIGKIHSSIVNYYPVYGSFNVSGGDRHAVVICGSNLISGYMTVMDPNGGFQSVTLTSGGRYSYVSPYTNDTLTLGGAFYYPTN